MAEATYIHGHHESVLESHRRRTADNSAGYLIPHLRPAMSLLDVGCGPGSITADLAALVSPGSVTAIENAPEALDAARGECAERGVGNVRFAVADVHALTFPDDTFDVVHAHQVLQHVADPVLALREMRRVCRPGGIVAARDADYAAMTWFPEIPELTEWQALYRATARADGGEPDAGRKLAAWATAAGFADVTPTTSTWHYATPEARRWWGNSWADRVTGSSFAERAVAHGFATSDDLQSIAAGWHGWAERADGWFTILHTEILATA